MRLKKYSVDLIMIDHGLVIITVPEVNIIEITYMTIWYNREQSIELPVKK